MISYVYQDGSWQYNTTSASTLKLTIPLPDSTMEEIAQLPITEVRKILGAWLSPDELDATHLQEVVIGKVAKWTGRLKNAHLPTHLAWTAYCHQLWLGVKYGLSTLANSKSKMDGILHKLEFKMLPLMGINRHAKTEWRHIAHEFGAIGLFNLAIEQFIGRMKTLLQHYSTSTTIAKKIRASIKALQLEIGCVGNPLNKNFDNRGALATPCCVKAIWESLLLQV
jgi:hypothetical protein